MGAPSGLNRYIFKILTLISTEKLTTPIGSLLLIVARGMLVYCNWEEDECSRKLCRILKRLEKERWSNSDSMIDDSMTLEETARQLSEYFSGQRREFELPIRLIGSEFQRKVWETLGSIPYGATATYGEMAAVCGCPRGSRALAAACGANPLAVILPCHRVVAANNRFGGYTGGLDKKLFLLSMEDGFFVGRIQTMKREKEKAQKS